ncbi:MAG: VanZ family protein [Planctomycetota bacterium]|nr:VanZ family protein [Planctomycetota bacterium]MDA1114341.1 VanZ family protein [Planctomycetota bacterium]
MNYARLLELPKVLRLAACLGALVAVYILGGLPGAYRPANAGGAWSYFSNFLHQPLYAGVGLSLLLALGSSSNAKREWALAVVFALCIGVLDEIHQFQTSARSSSLWDLGSDAYGAFCGVYIAHLSQTPKWLVHHALLLGFLLSLGLAWNCLPSFAPETPLPFLR